MSKRRLGRSDLEITPLVLGSNVFGWTSDEQSSFAVLDAFLEAGGNMIDTADVYSTWAPGHQGGESENVIGRWLQARKNRDRVLIATKVGGEIAHEKGLSRQHILNGVEASLRRLQTDVIDLYQAHIDDDGDQDETLQTFDELVKQGKVRVIGASNFRPQRLASALETSTAHSYARYESFQPPYNLVNRADYERDLEQICLSQHLGVITYSSLASGFLSGKYRQGQQLPQSQRASGIQSRYMNEKGFAVLKVVDEVAEHHHATPSQVALAWIIARPGITAPITSATSVEQLHELMGALTVELSSDDIAQLDRTSAWQ